MDTRSATAEICHRIVAQRKEIFMSSEDGKVAIVTGGASGIGLATTELFLERGASVVVLDRDESGLAALPEHDRLVGLAGDVTDAGTNERAVTTAIETFGRLDHAILNAGMIRSGAIETQEMDVIQRILDVNMNSVILGLRAVLPVFRAQGSGSVVVTASTSGMGGDPLRWAYSAAKAAVINMVQSIGLDLAPTGIRINAVGPGPIATGITRGLIEDHPEMADAIRLLVPMQRWGQPIELARAIAFLASDEASFITGIHLPVDGGGSAMSSNYRPEGSPIPNSTATGGAQ